MAEPDIELMKMKMQELL